MARYQSGNEKAEVEKGDAKDKVNISTIITLSAGKMVTGHWSVLLDAMRAIVGVHCHWSKFWDRQRNRSSGEKLSCLFKRFCISHLNVLVGARERESDYGLQVFPKDLMLEDFTLL